jgi:hypothetical protein
VTENIFALPKITDGTIHPMADLGGCVSADYKQYLIETFERDLTQSCAEAGCRSMISGREFCRLTDRAPKIASAGISYLSERYKATNLTLHTP